MRCRLSFRSGPLSGTTHRCDRLARYRPRRGHAITPALVVVAILAAIALTLISTVGLRTRGAYDAVNYHEKVIRTFAAQWPTPDLRDYLSATAPGYHLVLAGTTRLILGPELHPTAPLTSDATPPEVPAQRRVMQRLGLCFSLALVGILTWWIARRLTAPAANSIPPSDPAPTLTAITLGLIFAASPYVTQSAVWLLPDNAGWLCVCVVLLLALHTPRSSLGRWLLLGAMGLGVLAAVWTRQIHLWTAGLLWASAWLMATLPPSPSTAPDDAPLLSLRDLLPRSPDAWPRLMALLAMGIIVTLPAFASVWWLYQHWGQMLSPPTFKAWYRTGALQLGTSAFMLTLIAAWSVPLVGLWWPGARRAWTRHRLALSLAAALGLILGILGPTIPGVIHGRFGAIWSVLALGPNLADRSILLALGSMAGAMVVVCWMAAMPRRERWIMLAALVAFAASQTANQQLWQRYHDPMVLLWLVIAATLSLATLGWAGARVAPPAPSLALMARLGPMLLIAALVAWSAISIADDTPVLDEGFTLNNVQIPPHLRTPK
jgi:hypothetical protein